MTQDPPAGSDPAPAVSALARVPFPTLWAVHLLAVGFVVTQVFLGLAVRTPWLATGGVFATVAGLLLAQPALVRLTVETYTPGFLGGLGTTLRLLALVPPAALLGAAMLSRAPQELQGAALAGTAVTVLAAGLGGALHAAGGWLSRAVLATLAAGELMELVVPLGRLTLSPGSPWRRVAQGLAPAGELLAFAGVTLAVLWCARASVRAVGGPRTALFAVMPATLGALLASLPMSVPRTSEGIARASFGVRFALLPAVRVGHLPPWGLALYSLLLSGLLACLTLSLAAQDLSRRPEGSPAHPFPSLGDPLGPRPAGDPSAALRAFGWAAILMAGFGHATVVAVVDPLRITALALGMLLLEQAARQEPAALPEVPRQGVE